MSLPAAADAPGAATRKLVVPPGHLEGFFKAIMFMCNVLKGIVAKEDRLVRVPSPVYVLGDLHGNCEDLFWYADRLWPMNPENTAGRFLFLGDYVDRGLNSLEVIAYLFALKLLSPHKVVLLRGNHEVGAATVGRCCCCFCFGCCSSVLTRASPRRHGR